LRAKHKKFKEISSIDSVFKFLQFRQRGSVKENKSVHKIPKTWFSSHDQLKFFKEISSIKIQKIA
jgi:hypothetical protein